MSSTCSQFCHYNGVLMSTMASLITGLWVVYWTICSCTDQSKHQSSASLAFVRGIHRWPVNSPHNGPVTRKMFPFDDVIMCGCDLGRISIRWNMRTVCKILTAHCSSKTFWSNVKWICMLTNICCNIAQMYIQTQMLFIDDTCSLLISWVIFHYIMLYFVCKMKEWP